LAARFGCIIVKYPCGSPLRVAREFFQQRHRRFIGTDDNHRFTLGNGAETLFLPYSVGEAATAHDHDE